MSHSTDATIEVRTNGNHQPYIVDNRKEEGEKKDRRTSLQPLTDGHKDYMHDISRKIVTVCTGPAGTGKTYMACGMAAQLLVREKIDRIILSRPLISCGQGVGWLPGDLDEKVEPYMRPLLDALRNFLTDSQINKLRKEKKIEMLPLDLMRGASIKNTMLICDESQNAEYTQLHMMLTRFEKGSKIVVCGDASQSDTKFKKDGMNPLLAVIKRFIGGCHKDIGIVRLGAEDIVRHPLVQWIDQRLGDYTEGELEAFTEEDRWIENKCNYCQNPIVWEGSEDEARDKVALKCWNCGKYSHSKGKGWSDTVPTEDEIPTVVTETYSEMQDEVDD